MRGGAMASRTLAGGELIRVDRTRTKTTNGSQWLPSIESAHSEQVGGSLLLFLEENVLASLGVVLHELDALTAVDLVLRRDVLVASTRGALELDDGALIASGWHQTLTPRRRMSARTFSIPCLLMVLRHLAEPLSSTQPFLDVDIPTAAGLSL